MEDFTSVELKGAPHISVLVVKLPNLYRIKRLRRRITRDHQLRLKPLAVSKPKTHGRLLAALISVQANIIPDSVQSARFCCY